MRSFLLLALLALISCSTSKEKPPKEKNGEISNASFKKTKPLTSAEVVDYYSGNVKAMSPALEDETLDRHSYQEATQMAQGQDPLAQMALNCLQGKYDEAFAIARRAFDSYQKVPSYWNQIANCHLNQGSYRKALLFYNKALEVSPNYVPALNNIGVLYSRQKQYQKAIVAFEKACKQSRFAKTPRYNLAKLYITYGLADQALPILLGLLENSPQDIDLLNSVASAYFLQGDYQKALSYYERIPVNQQSNPEIGINLAWTLKKVNQGQNALKFFKSVTRPKTSVLLEYYSVVEAQIGERG